MTHAEIDWPFADYSQGDTPPPTLAYDEAVRSADMGLSAIVDQLARPDSPDALYMQQDRDAAGSAFLTWLWEHPDVYNALAWEEPYHEGFEPAIVEDYIAIHSRAFEILADDAQDAPGEPGAPIALGDTRDGIIAFRRRT